MKTLFTLIIFLSLNAKANISQSNTDGMAAALQSKALSDYTQKISGIYFQGIEIYPSITMDANRYYTVNYLLYYTNCFIVLRVDGLEGYGAVNVDHSNCIEQSELNKKIEDEVASRCVIEDLKNLTPEQKEDPSHYFNIAAETYEKHIECRKKVVSEFGL